MEVDKATVTLGSVLSILIDHRGQTPRKLGGDFSLEGVPVISAKNIKDGQIVGSDDLRYVTDEMYDRWMPEKLKLGDVLLTSEAPLGEAVYLQHEVKYCLGQRLFALRPDPHRLDARFLYYSLCYAPVQQRLHARATGTTAQGIRQSELVKVELDIPPLPEQRAIAHILGTLDDKIELNRRMNETLEAMARAIFKSCFVNFEPVRAKTEGSDLSLPQEFAVLFPDSFEDSKLGETPKGWTTKTIEEVCVTVTRGVTPKYEEGSGRYIINQRVNRGSDLDWSAVKELSTKLEVPPDRYAKRWDVLVNCLGEGTLGRTHLYKGASDIYSIDQHMSICRPKTDAIGAYIYQVLSCPQGQDKIESLKTGSTGMTMLNISKLRTFDFLWPGDAIVDAYFGFIEPIWLRIAANDEESLTLGSIRDTLLPKLISGEIRVKDVERVAERAA